MHANDELKAIWAAFSAGRLTEQAAEAQAEAVYARAVAPAPAAKPEKPASGRPCAFGAPAAPSNLPKSHRRHSVRGRASIPHGSPQKSVSGTRKDFDPRRADRIWMGGAVPLGYRVENRALHVVEGEAELFDVSGPAGEAVRPRALPFRRAGVCPQRLGEIGRRGRVDQPIAVARSEHAPPRAVEDHFQPMRPAEDACVLEELDGARHGVGAAIDGRGRSSHSSGSSSRFCSCGTARATPARLPGPWA